MEDEGYQSVADAIRERLDRRDSAAVLVGVGGSVCVGKTTTSERLRALLHPVSVEIVTTDGFLYPNAELARRDLVHAKGFPQSYDHEAIAAFLVDLRSGSAGVTVPQYSHESYDVVPDARRELADAAVVIVEGVNALRFRDRLDLGIYVDAPESAIEGWYAERLVQMFRSAPPGSFYASLGYDEAQQRSFAEQIWAGINHVNLVEYIEPTRAQADVVVEKGPDHAVVRVRFADRV
ncbi:MAG: type I pantothenate kinase [Acidimicrobiia bacterium]